MPATTSSHLVHATFPITIRPVSGLHPCSFCVIPQMRGMHRSRSPESVLAEIRALIREGVREINLISQDTTYYGMDLWSTKAGPRQPIDSTRGPTLAALLREVQQIEGEFWVRLLYTHPA